MNTSPCYTLSTFGFWLCIYIYCKSRAFTCDRMFFFIVLLQPYCIWISSILLTQHCNWETERFIFILNCNRTTLSEFKLNVTFYSVEKKGFASTLDIWLFHAAAHAHTQHSVEANHCASAVEEHPAPHRWACLQACLSHPKPMSEPQEMRMRAHTDRDKCTHTRTGNKTWGEEHPDLKTATLQSESLSYMENMHFSQVYSSAVKMKECNEEEFFEKKKHCNVATFHLC